MDNFYKTANRCFNSSKILHSNVEYFNACYLGGYVLECYGKLIFQKIYSTPPEDMKCYGHDVKKIIREIQQLLADPSPGGLLNPLYIIDLTHNCPTIPGEPPDGILLKGILMLLFGIRQHP